MVNSEKEFITNIIDLYDNKNFIKKSEKKYLQQIINKYYNTNYNDCFCSTQSTIDHLIKLAKELND
jgi:hypothetical protein